MDVVCHVITKLELGGAQEVAMQVVAGLDRSRFKPVLVAGPGGLLTEEACALKDVDVHILPSLRRDIHLLNDVRALWELMALFQQLRPKIVHTHSSKAGIVGRLAAWLAGVPYILHTVHGYGITPAQPAWLRRALIAFEWLAGRMTAHWVTVSQADRSQGLKWGLFSASQVSVIRPGIDLAPFAARIDWAERDCFRASLGVGSKHLLVGTVSCLKSQKCPEDFISIAATVCRRLPLARAVLVGDGVLRPQMEALLRAEGLEERVILLGWRRDVAALLKAFDVFVLTSRWEGLPCALLEARASRLPIVATNVGGAPEAVAGYAQATLYQPGEVQAMADRVCQLLEDEPYRRELRMSAKEVPEEFTIKETIKQYQSLYGYLTHSMRPIRDVMRLQTNRSGG